MSWRQHFSFLRVGHDSTLGNIRENKPKHMQYALKHFSYRFKQELECSGGEKWFVSFRNFCFCGICFGTYWWKGLTCWRRPARRGTIWCKLRHKRLLCHFLTISHGGVGGTGSRRSVCHEGGKKSRWWRSNNTEKYGTPLTSTCFGSPLPGTPRKSVITCKGTLLTILGPPPPSKNWVTLKNKFQIPPLHHRHPKK